MQSYYSLYGSRIVLLLEDEVAEAYNRAVDSFFEAQKEHRKVMGRKWNPDTDPLLIAYNKKDLEAYEEIGYLVRLMCKINGGGLSLTEEDTPSDYLIKL